MRQLFFIRLALLNTFKKRLRACLAIGGIALSSCIMIILFGVSAGLQQLVSTEISRSESKDTVTVNQRNIQQIKLDQENISKIQSISGVTAVERSVGLLGTMTYHGIALNLPTYGVTKDYFAAVPTTYNAGSGLELSDNDIVVSKKVLEVFGIDQRQAVGRQISANASLTKDYNSRQTEPSVVGAVRTYKIIGVVDRGELPVAYLPIEGLQEQGLDSVSQLKVRLAVPEKMPAVRESIEQMGFQTTSVQDTIGQINKLFGVIKNILIIFGFITFAITVSSAFTIITLTLMEETRQIGFLRISGLPNRDVKKLFIIQSVLLTSLGALFGIVCGVLGGAIVNGAAQAASAGEAFSGPIIIFEIPVVQIIIVLMLSSIIGWAVGILPAKRAILIKPLDELKE